MGGCKALGKCPNFFPALCQHSESCKCLSKKILPLNSIEYEHLALYYQAIPQFQKVPAIILLSGLEIIVFCALKWILFCRHWQCIFYSDTTIKYTTKP